MSELRDTAPAVDAGDARTPSPAPSDPQPRFNPKRGFGTGKGQPLVWGEDTARALLDLMEGETQSLAKSAQQLGVPYVSAHLCIHRHPELTARYRSLQEAMGGYWEEEAHRHAADGLRLTLDETVDAKRANAVASAARTLADSARWRAKVADPSRYGDQVNVKAAVDVRAVVLLPPLTAPAPAIAAATPAELAGPDAGALLSPAAPLAGDAGPLALDASAPGDASRPGTRPPPTIRAVLAPPAPPSPASDG